MGFVNIAIVLNCYDNSINYVRGTSRPRIYLYYYYNIATSFFLSVMPSRQILHSSREAMTGLRSSRKVISASHLSLFLMKEVLSFLMNQYN